MMECKSALQEANGDMEKAVEILRKKKGGVAKADRKPPRAASPLTSTPPSRSAP